MGRGEHRARARNRSRDRDRGINGRRTSAYAKATARFVRLPQAKKTEANADLSAGVLTKEDDRRNAQPRKRFGAVRWQAPNHRRLSGLSCTQASVQWQKADNTPKACSRFFPNVTRPPSCALITKIIFFLTSVVSKSCCTA